MSEKPADYITDARAMMGGGYEQEPKRADIIPLHGKYYGTTVTYDSGYGAHSVDIWIGDFSEPSKRQLEDWGMTLEEAKADGMMDDGHYETVTTYGAAVVLCKFLNGKMK